MPSLLTSCPAPLLPPSARHPPLGCGPLSKSLHDSSFHVNCQVPAVLPPTPRPPSALARTPPQAPPGLRLPRQPRTSPSPHSSPRELKKCKTALLCPQPSGHPAPWGGAKSSLRPPGPPHGLPSPLTALPSSFSPLHSRCSSHTGLLAVPPVGQARCCPRTFAWPVPAAWNAVALSLLMNSVSFRPQSTCHLLREALLDRPALFKAPSPPRSM